MDENKLKEVLNSSEITNRERIKLMLDILGVCIKKEDCKHPEWARIHYARDLYKCEICGYDGW